MGVYSEVIKKCPDCGGRGVIQISDVRRECEVFDLDDPQSIAEQLTLSHVRKLRDMIEDKDCFVCEDCRERFTIRDTECSDDAEKLKIIHSIGR